MTTPEDGGEAFSADVSLSPFEYGSERYLTIILRHATLREQAARKLKQLTERL